MSNSHKLIEIVLSNGIITLIDSCDKDLSKIKWYAAEWPNPPYAAHTQHFVSNNTKHSRQIRMHRLIMSRVLNRALERCEIVDHVNGNTLDNRRINLRLATYSGNRTNGKRQSNNTSGYKGVTWHKQSHKWQAGVKAKGHSYYLGLFDDPREAHEAYKLKAVELFGEFARFE